MAQPGDSGRIDMKCGICGAVNIVDWREYDFLDSSSARCLNCGDWMATGRGTTNYDVIGLKEVPAPSRAAVQSDIAANRQKLEDLLQRRAKEAQSKDPMEYSKLEMRDQQMAFVRRRLQYLERLLDNKERP